MISVARKPFIPIPPPAPIPQGEDLSASTLLQLWREGEIDLICIMGPTASGKTRYAVEMARQLAALGAPAEILSGDSRQVFRGMDIGTGKDMKEYGEIPCHLVDIVPAGARYDICLYQRDFSAAYEDCMKRGVIPILCGGSGLYIEAVTRPEYDLEDNRELNLVLPRKTFFIAIRVDREVRRARIEARLKERFEEGMLMEVKGLLEAGIPAERLIKYGLEYKYLTMYLTGQMDLEQMYTYLKVAIWQFAKRQMTWLRGMERDGVKIHWVRL